MPQACCPLIYTHLPNSLLADTTAPFWLSALFSQARGPFLTKGSEVTGSCPLGRCNPQSSCPWCPTFQWLSFGFYCPLVAMLGGTLQEEEGGCDLHRVLWGQAGVHCVLSCLSHVYTLIVTSGQPGG